jgi:succinate dehydrogenase (ubiquinone) membrane anchor subunit
MKILPAGPQIIKGGVNDPAPIPKANPLHGSYHWTFERIIGLGLVPLTIAPFATGSLNPTLDAVFIFGLIIHSHFGFQ